MRIGHQLGYLVAACTLGGLGVATTLWNYAANLGEASVAAQTTELRLEVDHMRLHSLALHLETTLDQAINSGSKYLGTVARGQADALQGSIQTLHEKSKDKRTREILAAMPASIDRLMANLERIIDSGPEPQELVDDRSVDAIDDEMIHIHGELEELIAIGESDLDKHIIAERAARLALESTAIVASVLYIGLIFAVWRWSVKSTIRPILHLANSAQRASEGGAKFQVREQGPEEVRVLVRSLHTFASGLETANGTLEEKVVSRTAELKEVNDRLEKDLSLREQLETELTHAHKLEAIGQLAAGIAHEINTPIQFVSDNIHFLEGGFEGVSDYLAAIETLLAQLHSGESTAESLKEIDALQETADLEFVLEETPSAIKQSLEGINRVATIVRAMKTFSHESRSTLVATDLNASVQNTALVARSEWKYVADLELALDVDLPAVTCDPGQINQAVLNLIVNAAHAIGEANARTPDRKGTITLGTRRAQEDIEIFVRDTGTGIPEDVRPKIFTPFYTTKEVGKGTGQGLAIVYNVIVKGHGGAVSFETGEGEGTTFVIRLPLASSRVGLPAVVEAA